MADKYMLTENVIKEMSSNLTNDQLESLRQCLSIQLDQFQLETKNIGNNYFITDDYLQAFISAKKIEGRSDKTIERYEYIIKKTIDYINIPTRQISVYHLRNYLSTLKEHGLSDRTLEEFRSIYSSYFGWLHKEGLIERNPSANLGIIKYKKKVRLPFSDIELHKIKENCKTDRDKSIVYFLLSSGCRVSEVCNLNRNSIDFKTKECIVLGKGNKERTVYIDNVTALVLKKYLNSRKDNSVALFHGKGTDRLKPGAIRKMLNDIGNRAGVENVHPHRFRRTLATSLINRGMPIQEVSCILGHENINTTMTYVHVTNTSVHNSYEKCM